MRLGLGSRAALAGLVAAVALPAAAEEPASRRGGGVLAMSLGPGDFKGEHGRGFGGEPLERGSGLAFELLVEVPVGPPIFVIGGALTGFFQNFDSTDEMVSGFDLGPGAAVRLGRWVMLYASLHPWLEMTGDYCPPDYICIGDDGDDPARSVGLMFRAGLFATIPLSGRTAVLVGVTPRYLAATRATGHLLPREHTAVQLSLGLTW